MKVKRSSWVIKKEYFKVMAVDNFKYLFIKNYDCGMGANENEFIERISKLDSFYVYMFPDFLSTEKEDGADFFEKEDENFVLKRDMFIILEDA